MNVDAPDKHRLPPPPKAPDLPPRDKHADDEGWLIGRGLLAQSLMLEEQGPERLIRLAAFVIGLMVLAFIVWAQLTSITEVTVASGEVSPVGSVKRIQHLEGGIVKAIHVTEGSRVNKGDVLVELQDAGITPELEQLRTRLKGYELQAAQLNAFISGKPFDLSKVDPRYRDLAKSQQDVLQSKLKANQAQADVLRQQLAQRRNELQLVHDQISGNLRQIQLLKEQVNMRKTLEKQGLISRVVLLNDQRELAKADSALAELRGKMRTSQDAIAEAEGRLSQMETQSRADASQQFAKVTGQIAELKDSIRVNEDRVYRLKIRSPVKGVVQQLQTQTVGGVISPGSTVMEIIPYDAQLMVEARISTSDIGFVYVGQKALVKFTAYDFTRYGGIEGEIKTISPTTITDKDGHVFYRAQIKLAKNYVGDNPERNIVLPGMEVVCDIKTGQKTLLAYLLKPVVKALDESFRER